MREWKKPELEVLDINMTFGGPGNATNDTYCTNNQNFETHDGKSNKSNSCGPS